jgi:hypothetical protein
LRPLSSLLWRLSFANIQNAPVHAGAFLFGSLPCVIARGAKQSAQRNKTGLLRNDEL